MKNETKLLRVLLKSDIAIFAWRVAKNYNYSPFERKNEKGYRMKPENLMRSMIHIRLLSDVPVSRNLYKNLSKELSLCNNQFSNTYISTNKLCRP